MPKSLDDLVIPGSIGPNPDLPRDRLPTLQERHASEGRKRPERPKPLPRSAKNIPQLERVTDNYGKLSPIKRAVRKKSEKVGDIIEPAAVRAMLIGGTANAPQPIGGKMTLAERVRQEGVSAYGDKFAEHAAQKAKSKKSPGAGK